MRRLLLWCARNRWLGERLPRLRFVRRAVRRFMPGEELAAALTAAETYRARGIGSVFTFLGENLADLSDAERVAAHYREVLDVVSTRGLGGEISVKLTQLGLDIDPEGAFAHFDGLARHAAERRTWAWIDMEGSAYTERTVAFYERTRAAHENVGLCLQAYLHRTPADVQRLLPQHPAVRLVKGAYDEPASVAHRRRSDVDAAFLALSTQLLEAVRDGNARFIAATHDTSLIARIAGFGEALGLDRKRIEVQMLYGIRTVEQRRLAAEGFDVRGLIAYGTAWYPWYMRRLAERPAHVVFALRQLLP